MKICITGALGHIGSKLIRNLSTQYVSHVYLVDNLFTQRYSSLFELPKKPKYLFCEVDVLSPDMEDIVKKSDVVIHLAAITDAESSIDKKALVDKVNKKGVEYIAKLCVKYNTALIFPSTTSVYGSQETFVDETCVDLKPQSPYAHSKLAAERYLNVLGKSKKIKFVILRLGTIFGYSIGMRFHTAVNKFLFQAINGQSISVWKTAYEQKRPYCDLNDAINAINFVIKSKKFDNETYNIVTKNYTVSDIVRSIRKYIPSLHISYVESRIMNQLSYNVDNSKSIGAGFIYKGNLNKSIKYTITKLKNVNNQVNKKGV